MKRTERVFPRSFIIVILLLEGLILAGGIVFHRVREERVLNDVRNELVAVARLKADQIGLWRRERLGDGGIIMESPFLVREAERLFAQEPDAGVETIRQHSYTGKAGVEAFVAEVGYPIVIKPDQGSGASNTMKIND